MALNASSSSALLLVALLHLLCLCVTTSAFVNTAANRQRNVNIPPATAVLASISESSILPATDEVLNEQTSASASCHVLLLDHININHEKGRHDVLKAFYFDFLGCAIDPRKYDNYLSGSKTVWANIGMHQFHLPEGEPKAQVWISTDVGWT